VSQLSIEFEPTLDTILREPYPTDRPPTVDERAAAFHQLNPSVFGELRELALADVARGAKYISIARLFETLRIRRSLETQDPSGFRLNNSYRAFFARRLMAVEPRLVGVFRLRDRACDKP
jgi:hypothetical protein